jgi:hypothetical protein
MRATRAIKRNSSSCAMSDLAFYQLVADRFELSGLVNGQLVGKRSLSVILFVNAYLAFDMFFNFSEFRRKRNIFQYLNNYSFCIDARIFIG